MSQFSPKNSPPSGVEGTVNRVIPQAPNWSRSNLPRPIQMPVTILPEPRTVAESSDENIDLNLDQLLADAYRLKFPREEERRFQLVYSKTSLLFIRAIVIASIAGFILFGIVDIWSLPQTYPTAWWIRYALICPMYALVLYATFRPKFQRSVPLLAGAAHLVGGLGLILILSIADASEPGHRLYFLGLIFVILGVHFSRLKFGNASIISWGMTLVYGAIAVLNLQRLTPSEFSTEFAFFIGNFFYLAFMNLAGMFVSYILEVTARSEFLQRRALTYEKRKSERLLFSILPQKIAKRLTQNRSTIAQEYAMASILFADIVNFTPLSEQLTPTELVSLLNDLFSAFDQLVAKYELEKIKTIGDCYMAAAGVPNPRADHAIAIAHLALDMLHHIQQVAEQFHYPINLRLGIHSGPVVAGVIGRQKFMYDLWGDTVNTASRMESHSEVGKIQISRETYHLIRSHFHCISNGAIAIKGKGEMETWYLLDRQE